MRAAVTKISRARFETPFMRRLILYGVFLSVLHFAAILFCHIFATLWSADYLDTIGNCLQMPSAWLHERYFVQFAEILPPAVGSTLYDRFEDQSFFVTMIANSLFWGFAAALVFLWGARRVLQHRITTWS
jgi:hypothetical protein